MTLFEIFSNHITLPGDRWKSYFPVYEQYLGKFIGTPITMIEVGVQGGGSMQMWQKWFGPQARIVGVDIDPAVADLPLPTQTIHIGDQADPKFWEEVLADKDEISVFIDDGGHAMEQQLQTLYSVWPRMAMGGVYICEDTHTSYYEHAPWDAGVTARHSFMNQSKHLVDAVNQMHHSLDLSIKTLESVHYYNSMVVMVKGGSAWERVMVNQK